MPHVLSQSRLFLLLCGVLISLLKKFFITELEGGAAGSTMTAANYDNQRHNLVEFLVHRCREFGDFLKVQR